MVIIENEQNVIEFKKEYEKIIKDAVNFSLKIEKFDLDCEINIILTDNKEIQQINFEQRNINKATDVLSFPFVNIINGKVEDDEGDYDIDTNTLMLGDMVISLERTKEQSIEYEHSFERELAFLTTHGIFHLLGYDHQTREEESVMQSKQEKVLTMMGLTRI